MRQFIKLLRRGRLRISKGIFAPKPATASALNVNKHATVEKFNPSGLSVRSNGAILKHIELKTTITSLESSALSVMERSSLLHEDLKRRKHSIQQTWENAIYNRKESLTAVIISRRKLLNELFKLRRKRMLLQIETKRDRLRSTEQRIMEQGRLIVEDLRQTKQKMKDHVDQVIEKENIYTIPNLLCVTRIVCSPYLGYLIISENYKYGLVFMAIAGFTDWVDGAVARNFKSQSTKIGSFLDPMADKVLIGTLFLTLTYVDLIPVALTGLIVARDVVLVIAGFVIRYKSLPPPRTLSRYFDATNATAQLAPTFISKINTGVQLAFVGCTLAAPVFDYVGHPALNVLCYVTAATTILSAFSYMTTKHTYKYLNKKS